jgi:hypothetical protein
MNIVPDTTYWVRVKTSGTPDVYSDTWSFKTVGWRCQEPSWDGTPTLDPNGGWPAWDQNHDCVVNDLDLWYFARDWQVNRGGTTNFGGKLLYTLDMYNLDQFLDEWMTCRARTDGGCDDWPLTPDYPIILADPL